MDSFDLRRICQTLRYFRARQLRRACCSTARFLSSSQPGSLYHGITSILQLPGFWPACGHSTSYHHTSPSSWYLFVSPGAREPNTSRGVDACIQARMLVFRLLIYPNYCDFRHCACLTRLPSRLHCTLPSDNKVLPCSTVEESMLQHGPIPEQQPAGKLISWHYQHPATAWLLACLWPFDLIPSHFPQFLVHVCVTTSPGAQHFTWCGCLQPSTHVDLLINYLPKLYCDLRHCVCLTRLPSRLHCTPPSPCARRRWLAAHARPKAQLHHPPRPQANN